MTERRGVVRRKRAHVPGGRQVVHRVRCSVEEEAALLALCAAHGGLSVPDLLMQAVLSPDGETPSERRQAMGELFAIRRQLAGIAVNVNQAARRANVGDGFPVVEAREVLGLLRVLAGPGGRLDAAIRGLSGAGVAC